jgi:hypothetical protein
MSPRAIAIQAFLVLLSLLALSILSSPPTARWYGGCLGALSILLLLFSRIRARGSVLLAGIVPLLLAASPWLVGARHPGGLAWSPDWRAGFTHGDLDSVLVILIGSTTAFTAIYFSSLIDAAYVRPLLAGRGRDRRMPGQSSLMPCQSSLDQRWTGLTAVWLMHRLLATLGFVLGLTVVVTITVKHWVVPNDNPTTAAGIAAAATLLAGFYLTRARSVIAFAPNPALSVGDAVELIDEGTHQARRYYVQDVALEGIKLLALSADDTSPKASDSVWPSHDRMLDLLDVLKALRARQRFTPCGRSLAQCKRVNPYCQFKPDSNAGTAAGPDGDPTGLRAWQAAALIGLGAMLAAGRHQGSQSTRRSG